MPRERKRIGDVLVEAKIITPQQLEEALKIQKQTNKNWERYWLRKVI